jgi:6-pyruvoyltetrahydropterin/6-carboxytetrahydropterin synthase
VYAISKRFTFHAAHTADCGPSNQPTLHGHTFTVTVRLAAELLAYPGVIVDRGPFDRLRRHLNATFNHRNLDDVLDGPPVNRILAEHLRAWCQDKLHLPRRVRLDGLEVHAPATTTAGAMSHLLGFEAAHWLPGVRNRNRCGPVHGHSYTVCPVFASPLTGTEQARILAPLRAHLAHHFDYRLLNDEFPDIPPTSENIARHLFDWFTRQLPLQAGQLTALRVSDNPTTWIEYQPGDKAPA